MKLHPYQDQVVVHQLTQERECTFAPMGSGKTLATLTALDTLYMAGSDERPTLVLAPLRVAQSTWPDEAKKWPHLKSIEVSAVVGSAAARARALARPATVYTMNYENLPWLVEHLRGQWPFGTVVADESTRLKSFRLRQGGARAQALARVAHGKTRRWVNLTGTPNPNGLQDLWGQLWFVDGGQRLGKTFSAFSNRWFRTGPNGFGMQAVAAAQGEIEDAIRDVCLSIDISQHLDLREPVVRDVVVDLPAKARKVYDDMSRKMFASINGHEVESFSAAAKTMKCLQLANGAAYVDEDAQTYTEVHDAKLQALESVVNEASGPVLVAYHFRCDLERMQRAFPQGRHLDANPQTIRDWNAGRIPILFAHPASAGHGLNLQDGGNVLVFFGLWWDLEQHDQITERIGPARQAQAGHKRPVFIYRIVARGTVDELVLRRLATKRSVQDLLIEAMKGVV